ncbi:DUF4365 domain-containing protein [Acidobacteria bacterium AH-259-D05]|nr:DUF4365 domain-containing protein [Acidobacteria bacterium AH-259-D05]
MGTVDRNRLKGNYGASYVAACLSSECLVRPVAADTDVGVDLYCETVEDDYPFLHFWMQVKAGAQCRVSENLSSAKCSFTVKHLSYWNRQPVPVFAALVPVDGPVLTDPTVYVVDVTSQLLDGVPAGQETVSLKSDYLWKPGAREDVRQFLTGAVPVSAARLYCKQGQIASIPTLRPEYELCSPLIPVSKFKDRILRQLRTTAANSLLFLHSLGELNEDQEFRRLLASVVEQFGDDPHWENFMSRALSHHADGEFEKASEMYKKAKQTIENDPRVRDSWKQLIQKIEEMLVKAENGEELV